MGSMPLDLKVYSHPRSGTHFLGCALYLNFELRAEAARVEREYFRKEQPRFLGLDGESEDVPWASIAAHRDVHRFRENVSDCAQARLYLVRGCKEVLASVYHWRLMRNHRDEPLLSDEQLSFEEFLRRPLGWSESVHQRTENDFTPVEHWAYHTSTWLDSGEFWVRYEDLVRDYESTLKLVEERFGLVRKPEAMDAFLPVPGRVGYNPTSARDRAASMWTERTVNLWEEQMRWMLSAYPGARLELQGDRASGASVADDPRLRHLQPLHRVNAMLQRANRREHALGLQLEKRAKQLEERAKQLEDCKARLSCAENAERDLRAFLRRVENLLKD